MAQRRMFSLKIIDSDKFIEMPTSTRLLYYDLSMRADDDGFVGSPKKILKMIGASEDDLKVLISKQFIIPFESGVCVIKDWKIHNYIQSDRYDKTHYIDELNQLELTENKSYTKCIQDVNNMDTQYRLGKVSIGKVREELGKVRDIDLISDDKIDIPDKENEKTENDVTKNQSGGEVEEIYKSYPGKCPVSSRVTGKSSKDKDKIKKVLKTISYQELKETINLYLEECIKTKTYIKNFDTFLNNLPDLNDLKLKSPKDETKEERALRIAKLAFGDIIKNEREIKSEVIYE